MLWLQLTKLLFWIVIIVFVLGCVGFIIILFLGLIGGCLGRLFGIMLLVLVVGIFVIVILGSFTIYFTATPYCIVHHAALKLSSSSASID